MLEIHRGLNLAHSTKRKSGWVSFISYAAFEIRYYLGQNGFTSVKTITWSISSKESEYEGQWDLRV